MRFTLQVPFLTFLLCSSLAGCGSSGAQVKGIVLENGNPIQLKENEEVTMAFHATDSQSKVNLGSVSFDPANGAFSVHSPTHAGIPPGEYKISIACHPYQEENKDRFAKAFSAEKTPLRYTVADTSPQEIVIDVAKKTVAKK